MPLKLSGDSNHQEWGTVQKKGGLPNWVPRHIDRLPLCNATEKLEIPLTCRWRGTDPEQCLTKTSSLTCQDVAASKRPATLLVSRIFLLWTRSSEPVPHPLPSLPSSASHRGDFYLLGPDKIEGVPKCSHESPSVSPWVNRLDHLVFWAASCQELREPFPCLTSGPCVPLMFVRKWLSCFSSYSF